MPENIEHWFNQPLGQSIANEEGQVLSHHLSELFGYHLLYIGVTKKLLGAIENSPISHRLEIIKSEKSSFQTPLPDIALKTNSIDVVMLIHSLEVSSNQYALLEEAIRVLRPEGRLIISSFNQHSQWGLRKFFARRNHKFPWCTRFQREQQIRKFLCRLGCRIVDYQTIGFLPPMKNQRWLKKLDWLQSFGKLVFPYFGCVSIVVCRKEVAAELPLVTSWRLFTKVSDNEVVEPAARLWRILRTYAKRVILFSLRWARK